MRAERSIEGESDAAFVERMRVAVRGGAMLSGAAVQRLCGMAGVRCPVAEGWTGRLPKEVGARLVERARMGVETGATPVIPAVVAGVLEAMEGKNMTKVCAEAGLTRTAVWRWKQGVSPSVDALEAVARVLGLRLELVKEDGR